MNLTLDRVADLLNIDRPGRRKRRRSVFTLRVRAGVDLLELGRRAAGWLRTRWDEHRRKGTAEDPRLETALSREEDRS